MVAKHEVQISSPVDAYLVGTELCPEGIRFHLPPHLDIDEFLPVLLQSEFFQSTVQVSLFSEAGDKSVANISEFLKAFEAAKQGYLSQHQELANPDTGSVCGMFVCSSFSVDPKNNVLTLEVRFEVAQKPQYSALRKLVTGQLPAVLVPASEQPSFSLKWASMSWSNGRENLRHTALAASRRATREIAAAQELQEVDAQPSIEKFEDLTTPSLEEWVTRYTYEKLTETLIASYEKTVSVWGRDLTPIERARLSKVVAEKILRRVKECLTPKGTENKKKVTVCQNLALFSGLLFDEDTLSMSFPATDTMRNGRAYSTIEVFQAANVLPHQLLETAREWLKNVFELIDRVHRSEIVALPLPDHISEAFHTNLPALSLDTKADDPDREQEIAEVTDFSRTFVYQYLRDLEDKGKLPSGPVKMSEHLQRSHAASQSEEQDSKKSVAQRQLIQVLEMISAHSEYLKRKIFARQLNYTKQQRYVFFLEELDAAEHIDDEFIQVLHAKSLTDAVSFFAILSKPVAGIHLQKLTAQETFEAVNTAFSLAVQKTTLVVTQDERDRAAQQWVKTDAENQVARHVASDAKLTKDQIQEEEAVFRKENQELVTRLQQMAAWYDYSKQMANYHKQRRTATVSAANGKRGGRKAQTQTIALAQEPQKPQGNYYLKNNAKPELSEKELEQVIQEISAYALHSAEKKRAEMATLWKNYSAQIAQLRQNLCYENGYGCLGKDEAEDLHAFLQTNFTLLDAVAGHFFEIFTTCSPIKSQGKDHLCPVKVEQDLLAFWDTITLTL